jgi:hypothetical protein
MYRHSGEPRSSPGQAGEMAGSDPLPPARLALTRVRLALSANTPGMPFDAPRYRAALTAPAAVEHEAERLFCLGWLYWLDGDAASAEPLFSEAVDQARSTDKADLFAEASYWRVRVGLVLQPVDALASYEMVLRTAGGLPRATAWFVDLLWRAGRVERAEQILKTVGSNRRFASCDEVPLLEARSCLRRGQLAAGERTLKETAPAGTVAQAERWLLLAWIAASQNKHDEAARQFEQARLCLYPAVALEAWRQALARRAGATNAGTSPASPALLSDFIRGQEHRLAGRLSEAAAAYGAALAGPAAPFTRYALARMGSGDFTALLAAQPGLFLALRCRLQLVLARFLRREASPGECLDALHLAATVGYGGATAEHYRVLATALRQRNSEVAAVKALAAAPGAGAGSAERRNFLRAAAELAIRRLPLAEASALLEEWSARAEIDMRATLERQLLHSRLLTALEAAAVEQPGAEEALHALVAPLLDSETATTSLPHAKALWSAARALDAAGLAEAWSRSLRELPAYWRPLAGTLLLYEAARRRDAGAVAALLDEKDLWQASGARPPRFVIAAVENIVASRPDLPVWEHVLPRWLGLWQGTVSKFLSSRTQSGACSSPPPGMAPATWFLHQASRALGCKDYIEALACVYRVPDSDAAADSTGIVRLAIPELERSARAQALAAALRPDGLASTPASFLVDAVDLLLQVPAGARLVDAAVRNDAAAVRAATVELFEVAVLPARLLHHFALLERRCAEFYEAEDRVAEAVAVHRRSWGWWLRFLAAGPPDSPPPEAAALLAEELLGSHRRRVNALLARGAVDSARLHWDLIGDLPARASKCSAPLGDDFADRVARFRDELATDFLLATREGMRHAPATEGFRADYDSGLTGLRRLLSLDRDNPRLLTALVDICGDWFFDLYNGGAGTALAEQVERFTPFALQLARLVEGRPGDLAARAALAGFTKFRGFVAPDRSRKAELYREALRFNPADENVRELLAQLEGSGGPSD